MIKKNELWEELVGMGYCRFFADLSAGLDNHLPIEDKYFFHSICLNITQQHAHTKTHDSQGN